MSAFGGKAVQRAAKCKGLVTQLVVETLLPEKTAGGAPGKHNRA
jgi:hypothetical protein